MSDGCGISEILESAHSVFGNENVEPLELERRRDRVTNVDIVLHHQHGYATHWGAHGAAPRSFASRLERVSMLHGS